MTYLNRILDRVKKYPFSKKAFNLKKAIDDSSMPKDEADQWLAQQQQQVVAPQKPSLPYVDLHSVPASIRPYLDQLVLSVVNGPNTPIPYTIWTDENLMNYFKQEVIERVKQQGGSELDAQIFLNNAQKVTIEQSPQEEEGIVSAFGGEGVKTEED
ncbi:MAG TPA: hypothetical protein VMZ91_02110, partial [Candidatus Paceibacterota bacterium]|nr:hypothetical protein [Candidatus Paceibacterota bacterium]